MAPHRRCASAQWAPPPPPPPSPEGLHAPPPLQQLPPPQLPFLPPVPHHHIPMGHGLSQIPPWLYTPPYSTPNPPLGPHYLATQLLPWGYPHHTQAMPPLTPIPNWVAAQAPNGISHHMTLPTNDFKSEVHGHMGVDQIEQSEPQVMAPIPSKKKCPHTEVSKGVWQFFIDVVKDRVRHTFSAHTNMTWSELIKRVHPYLEQLRISIRLGYCISGSSRTPASLTCELDWDQALCRVREKIAVARTRTVTMEIINLVKPPLAVRRWDPHNCDNDIPPAPPTQVKYQQQCLLELQRHLLCQEHSKGGPPTYCWIDSAMATSRGGHREVNHLEMTLWAKNILLGTATKTLLPNMLKNDHPPTKKHRALAPAPEVLSPQQGFLHS
ncbi:hypothetical protein DFH94DRAFT_692812 [Russula ochroleuca]|uniref:Uncharacterized protein n=1 Tax=Russula ochroleuca TaxID=152965 RepID=A0A9P5MWQ9_9AGAM|nr:hypothetical protein DFH94DRAFT_692812 [Russula ochroleuca]